mgnify:CR=1 FL=1
MRTQIKDFTKLEDVNEFLTSKHIELHDFKAVPLNGVMVFYVIYIEI